MSQRIDCCFNESKSLSADGYQKLIWIEIINDSVMFDNYNKYTY